MLADSDAALVERASAEVMHVHGERMAAAKVTERKVKHKARQLCCEYVFKNTASRSGHRPSIILPFKVPEVNWLSLSPLLFWHGIFLRTGIATTIS